MQQNNKITILLIFLLLLSCGVDPIVIQTNSQSEENLSVEAVGELLDSDPIEFPTFPESLPYDLNVVFIGINRSWVNQTRFLERLPKISQISRYVPLSYLFETYINYSFNYHMYFMEEKCAKDLSKSITNLGEYGFSLEMGLFWSGRTNITTYRRITPDSCRTFLEDNINNYNTDFGYSPSLQLDEPTIFITNLFVNGSDYYVNQSAHPHVYYLAKTDLDTGQVSDLRKESYKAPGFDWDDARWAYLDISSGPIVYETVDAEYTNFIDYLEGTIDSDGVTNEYITLTRACLFSRFTPTYVFDPLWKPNVEICVPIYHDGDFVIDQNISLGAITSAMKGLFPFSTISIRNSLIEIVEDDEVDQYLDYIASYTDYSTWATKLVEFVKSKESDTFGSYDSTNTLRLLCGVFASSRIAGAQERALGYTYGYLGSGRPLGSVVTITPAKVETSHEGYTQTVVHELAHAISLRHPHDFRYDGSLYQIWTWDICDTPLSYYHSVYDFGQTDQDCFFRGNYRHLFNKTISTFLDINATLTAKSFPANRFPSNMSTILSNVSNTLDSSLSQFMVHDYNQSLNLIRQAYLQIDSLLQDITNIPDYFLPVVNFHTVNNTAIDYGDTIHFSGDMVSYERPNITLSGQYLHNFAEVNATKNDLRQYESIFSCTIASRLIGKSGLDSTLEVLIFDGVSTYPYSLVFSLLDLHVTIISPSNEMMIDFTHSQTLTVYGNYIATSNTSSITVLYGSYWYVKDREDNSSYWVLANKTTGNEWLFTINDISSFKNGDNLIQVRISNGVSIDEDNISIQISGLPTTAESSSLSTTSPPNTNTSTTNSTWFDQLLETFSFLTTTFSPLVFGGSLVGLFLFLRRRRRIKIIEKIPEDIVFSHKKHISDLSEAVERRLPDTKADIFKPKRRKDH